MALLQVMSEEQIGEDRANDYFDRLYKLVCVAERPPSMSADSEVIRTTYIVDWEQLVHLLEDYTLFGEDIVEVKAISGEEASFLRRSTGNTVSIARA